MSRSGIVAVLAVLALVIGSPCGCSRRNSNDDSRADDRADADGPDGRAVLTVSVAVEPDQLVPPFAKTAGAAAIWEWILPSLVRFDGDSLGAGRPVGDLAASWQQEDDGRAMRFFLDQGRFWQDTTQVTAEDVVTTYGLYREPRPESLWPGRLDAIQSVEGSPDGGSVLFRFRRPLSRARALELAALPCISSRQWEALRDRSPLLGEPERPVHAAGPFVIEEWRRGEYVRLVAHPFPPRDRIARTRRIQLRFAPAGIARGLQVEQGVADVAVDLPVEEILRLRREAPDVTIVRAGVASVQAITWNVDDPIWGGVGIRNAAARALDRVRLLRAAAGGMPSSAMPCDGFLKLEHGSETAPRPASPLDDVATLQRTDSAAAATDDTTAAVAGTPEAAPDSSHAAGEGVQLAREAPRGGLDLAAYGSPELEILFDATSERRQRIAVEMLLQLRHASVPARLVPQGAGELWRRIAERRFQAVIAEWSISHPGAIGEIWGSGGSANVAGLTDSSADSILAFARSPAADTTSGAWERLERRGRATASHVFVERRVRYDALAPGVRGYRPSPLRPYGDLLVLEKTPPAR